MMGAVQSRLPLFLLLVVVLPLLAAACGTSSTSTQRTVPNPNVLLFNGRGASSGDVAAVEDILRARGLDYATASSSRLDAMSESELKTYRLIVVPGGNFVDVGNGVTTSTAAKLRKAIGSGLNYLGLCAGAFFAGASPYNGLSLTSGVRFPFYSLENAGTRKAPVTITPAGGAAAVEVYWEDGPQLTGWGQVVARYPDGTPAVAQGAFGDGWVVLSGVHPEAPESWRRGLGFSAPAGASQAYAGTLIDAAFHHTPLPHY
jgi:glutamine amidotransferase-like uncharacterized protein